MKKIFKTFIKRLDVVALFALILFGVVLHYWADATCDSPKTCIICGKEEGNTLEHKVSKWDTLVESTCDKEGVKYGYCDHCGYTQYEDINKLPHVESEWVIEEDYIVNEDGTVTPGKEIMKCAECNNNIDEREYTLEVSKDQSDAIFVSHLFIKYLHCGKEMLANDILVERYRFSAEDAKFSVDNCNIDWKEQALLAKNEFLEEDSTHTESEARLWLTVLDFTDEEITYAFNN